MSMPTCSATKPAMNTTRVRTCVRREGRAGGAGAAGTTIAAGAGGGATGTASTIGGVGAGARAGTFARVGLRFGVLLPDLRVGVLGEQDPDRFGGNATSLLDEFLGRERALGERDG